MSERPRTIEETLGIVAGEVDRWRKRAGEAEALLREAREHLNWPDDDPGVEDFEARLDAFLTPSPDV